MNIQKSYETLYNLSELPEEEQNILEVFSMFPYIPLTAEICNQWLLVDAGVGEDADILIGQYRTRRGDSLQHLGKMPTF